jgi:hypothetical protein
VSDDRQLLSDEQYAALDAAVGGFNTRTRAKVTSCTCPDRWCHDHARCICGSELIIADGDPAFCPACGHDVMPAGACSKAAKP